MTFYQDLGTETMVMSGPSVRAVGWLHRDHPFPKGPVSREVLQRIQEFARLWNESNDALGWGRFRGLHTCEFCRWTRLSERFGVSLYGNFGVPSGEVLYAAPEMIAHYIKAHHYLPPEEFMAAILHAPLPGTEEYRVAVQAFQTAPRPTPAKRRPRRAFTIAEDPMP